MHFYKYILNYFTNICTSDEELKTQIKLINPNEINFSIQKYHQLILQKLILINDNCVVVVVGKLLILELMWKRIFFRVRDYIKGWVAFRWVRGGGGGCGLIDKGP